MTPVQIPFDIPIREAFEAEDYLVTASNRAAVDWIDRWPDWPPTHCTILYGTAGCGKSHLSHVWQGKSAAVQVDLNRIEEANFHELPLCLILEDVDQILGNSNLQERLFHLYNNLKERDGFLLLTARQHPKHWPVNLADLRSRMLASMTIEIGPPDDQLLAAVIVKLFADRQINVPMEVVNYLIPRIERSFEAARN